MQYWQTFSYFFIFFCYLTHLKALEVSFKIWEAARYFPYCTQQRAIATKYTFLAIYFARYKEYTSCFFSDVLPPFTCAGAIGTFWSICLGLNFFLYFSFFYFIGNISFLKALWVNSRTSSTALTLSKEFFYCIFFWSGFNFFDKIFSIK